MNDLQKIGHALRVRRIDLNKTQDQVATKAGIEQTYLSGIENGRRNVSLNVYIALARALGVEPGGFLDKALNRRF